MTSPDIFIFPGALEIMGTMAHTERATAINFLYPDKKARLSEIRVAQPKVPLASLSRMCTEMEDMDLFASAVRGEYELTPLGVVAVEASRVFHNGIKAPFFAYHRPQFEMFFGQKVTEQREQDFVQTEQPSLGTRRVMDLLGHNAKVRIMLVLSENHETVLPRQFVLEKASEVMGKEIPNSTFSNLLAELERGNLLQRSGTKRDPQLISTTLGETATEGFVEFQETLAQPLFDSEVRMLKRDGFIV